MADVVTNTSPLQYLYRAGAIEWLPQLFDSIWVPEAVLDELEVGGRRGYDVPSVAQYNWIQIVNPQHLPSAWLALDLSPGELAAMALALENPQRVVLLDDLLARRTAQAAGVEVWGTLRVVLEAKAFGLIESVAPVVDRLSSNGMWISAALRARILN